MKIIIFDVNNASCNIVVSPTGHALMIDCGSHSEKDCPVESIKGKYKDWLNINPVIINSVQYNLALLHITHPDDDDVKNTKEVVTNFTPYLLERVRYEEFPDNEKIHDEYKKYADLKYRGNEVKFDFGFDKNRTYNIPMSEILKDEDLSEKPKNNSSILRFIEYKGVRVLFGGDLEKAGWEWLIKNNQDFVDVIKNGIDILIAPHHGHKSGFPTALFDLIGEVKMPILSKASESEKEDTDVSSQYSQHAKGARYKNLNDEQLYFANGSLTTRSNGNIFLKIGENGEINFFAEKASSNHSKV